MATVILDLSGTLPQTFTTGNYPLSTLNSGRFHFTWTPTAASSDAAWGAGDYCILATSGSPSGTDNGGIYISNDQLSVYNQTGALRQVALTWGAGAVIDLTFNTSTGSVTISGATTGNGTYTWSPSGTIFTGGTLGVGVYGGGGFNLPSSVLGDIDDGATGATITADPGSVAITGTAATLRAGRRLTAAAGSVAVTGTDATLRPPSTHTLSAESGAFAWKGRDAALFTKANAPIRRGSTAPAAGLSATSPASTEVGDMVIVATWERNGAGSATHTLQSGYTQIRSHLHDDGSTDGRLSVAYKIAASAGATSYQAYTSSDGTATWTGIYVVRRGTHAITGITSASVTSTTNAVPDPPSVTLGNTRNWLVIAVAAWHHGSTATITPTAPTNYANLIEVAGTSNGDLAICDRTMLAAASEDPGTFGDNIAPNGTCSMTIGIPNVIAYVAGAPGEYTITGTDATLTYTPRQSSVTLTASAGSVAITGTAATLRYGRKITAAAGIVAITGTAAALIKLRLVADPGAVALTGTAAALRATRTLSAASGAFAVTGTNASLTQATALAIGAHGVDFQIYGLANRNAAVTLTTTNDDSIILTAAGGKTSDVNQITTDNKGNTFVRVLTTQDYPDFPGYGVSVQRAKRTVAGGSSHTMTVPVTLFDENTTFAIQIAGGKRIAAISWKNVANASGALSHTSDSVTTYKPAVLLAFWWGSGPVFSPNTTPFTASASGFTALDSYLVNNGNGEVQAASAARVEQTPGTYTVTWSNTPSQGAQLILIAIQAADILAADAGSCLLTGTNATLRRSLRLTAAVGAMAITGTNASFRTGKAVSANAGVVAITGTAATLKPTRAVVAAAGSVAVTGTAADLAVNHRLTAIAGSLAITGTAAGLPVVRRLTAAAGNVAITGAAAALTRGRPLAANAGAIAITGAAVSMRAGKVLSAAAGSIALGGVAAGLALGHRLTAVAGAIAVTGTVAAITPSRRIPATAGAVSIASAAASLLVVRRVTAAAGSVAVGGTAVGLASGRRLHADPGAVGILGTAASLRVTRRLTADPGAVAVTGVVAELTRASSNTLIASPGAVATTGADAELHAARRLLATVGEVVILVAGPSATLRLTRKLSVAAGAVVGAGVSASLRYTGELAPLAPHVTIVRTTPTGPALTRTAPAGTPAIARTTGRRSITRTT